MNPCNIDVVAIMNQIRREAEEKYKSSDVQNTSPEVLHTFAENDEPVYSFNPWKEKTEVNIQDLKNFEGEEFLRETYRAILNREADESGFENYMNILLTNGNSKEFIIRDICKSAEGAAIGKRIFGFDELHLNDLLDFEDREFITNCYYQILRRGPDKEGFDHFLRQLRCGKCTKIDIISTMTDSPEIQTNQIHIVVVGLANKNIPSKNLLPRIKETLSNKDLPSKDLLPRIEETIEAHGYLFGKIEKEFNDFENQINSCVNTIDIEKEHLFKELISREESNKEEIDFLKDGLFTGEKDHKQDLEQLHKELADSEESRRQELDQFRKGLADSEESRRQELDQLRKELSDSEENRRQELDQLHKVLLDSKENRRQELDQLRKELLNSEESRRQELDQLYSRIDRTQLLIDDAKEEIRAVAQHLMAVKWFMLDNFEKDESPEDTLTCKICGHSGKRKDYEIRETDCKFNGGHLVRYVCPECGVVFGPTKFRDRKNLTIDDDYRVHYIGFSEGDSTYKEKRAFFLLEPDKKKRYLNYGCGKWSDTLKELREEGYDVYGYEPYAPDTGNPYMITNPVDLFKYRFDGIFSNDLLEHLLDPVNDLKWMSGLLISRESKMSHCTSCYTYKYEYTRFHTHFFLGDSVRILADKAGLDIVSYVNDIEINDFYCYVFAPKEGKKSILQDMKYHDGVVPREGKLLLQNGGKIYGPYLSLPGGRYRLELSLEPYKNKKADLSYKITADKGESVLEEGLLKQREQNTVEFQSEDEIHDLEFVINNAGSDTRISEITLEKLA